MRHPIPDAALDDRLGFVGTAGSGKTYNASACVERLLDTAARVVVVDPLDVWWGLRLISDGSKSSRYSMPIFGGAHGDLPLNEHAGALIGETVAGMSDSCIVSLGGLQTKSAERRFMLAFLDAIYRKASGEPVHIIFDEADLWAPQKSSEPMLQSRMEEICRRGRVKGLIPWLITQRPAVISKDVLSQVDGLVAFKLTSSQDRDALEGWIEGQADRAQWKEIRAALPTMERGQGVVWLPGRRVLETAKFPAKRTFDSSRTPKRGEAKRTAALKPLDLTALKGKLANVEAETKANDPKMLKAEIAKLQADLAKAQKNITQNITVDSEAEQKAYVRGKIDGYADAVKGISAEFRIVIAALDRAEGTFKDVRTGAAQVEEWAKRPVPQPIPRPAGRVTPSVAPRTPAPAHNGHDTDRPLGAERRPLAVLAGVHPAGMTESQWAVAAGLRRTGGTWAAYVSRLRSAGRINREGDLFFVTDAGLSDLGSGVTPLPPPGLDLVSFWTSRISGVAPMLNHLAEAYPHWMTRDELAEALSLAASGGTFNAYLSRLRSPGLIEEDADKRVRASAELMG